jgi:Flp pilus assembly secretin CpaC/Arc/MetJ family transcription regulator
MNAKPSTTKAPSVLTAALLLTVFPGVVLAQTDGPLPPQPQMPVAASAAEPAHQPTGNDKRRAVKLFLEAGKLFQNEKFEEAMRGFNQAAALDPSNTNYALAAALARSHAVTVLIQSAAKDRLRGDPAAARATLADALQLDPRNIEVTEHLHELGDDALLKQPESLYEEAANTAGESVALAPNAGSHSFHIHLDQRQVIQQVFKTYGLEATVDDSVHATPVQLDVDDASFGQAMRILNMLTDSFYVPLDSHRAVVAHDTSEMREQFMRQAYETIYLPGLDSAELTDVGNLARNVFEVQQEFVEQSSGTLSIRAPESSLEAFNATIRQLIDGHSQVLLEVRIIQIAHTSDRNTGIQPPQSISAFNVYAEEQSILNANQALVQQIIASGLAAPGDTLAILGILLASGQVSSSLFSNGIALFGGGLTQSALSPGPVTANLNLNSSDSRQLDELQLRLGDNEAGTVRSGTRYPIQTSSFSSLSGSIPNIPGLTGAGSSSSLSSLLSSLGASVPNVPQIEYQDLGMTLKATPNVMRNNEVALTLDLKINALASGSINGNPILNNRAYSGVVTLKQGEGVVVVSDLDKQESRAISGVPGISELPGLNDVTDKDTQKNYASLLIVITPHVIRGTQSAGHSTMVRIEKDTAPR